MATGVFVYVAFVIDAYAGAIVGWECRCIQAHPASSNRAIRQAAALRSPPGPSDAGTPSTTRMPDRNTPRCDSAKRCCSGLQPSIGTVGDAFDNALAETTIGLYKNECVRDDSPFRSGPMHHPRRPRVDHRRCVHWYNTARLMHRLGRRPPIEAEAEYWATASHTAQAATR